MKHAQSSLAIFFKQVNVIADFMATLSTLAIFIIVMIQVIGRVSGNPAPWTEEATRVFFIGMIYMGIGIGFRRAESARVTVFLDWFPAPMRKLSRWLYVISTIGFFVFMFLTGIQLVVQQYTMNEMGAAFMIPMWLVGAFVPVSAVLGILGVVESLVLHPHLIEGGK